MLFRNQDSRTLAISQLTHAWISGQILRAWSQSLGETLLLAAEQHDIGWLDWEASPTFNPHTGRPHLFREIGAATHAPMWIRGVERALGAWGAHVALLISRHGGVIYSRYTDRHRVAEADAVAAERYLKTQPAVEKGWATSLGLDDATMKRETALVAFADTLSLALCGELKSPLELAAPDRNGDMIVMRLEERQGLPFEFSLSPWPFREKTIVVEGEARALPEEGRFADEIAMRKWLATPERVTFRARLKSQA
jgi:hypothetical protein